MKERCYATSIKTRIETDIRWDFDFDAVKLLCYFH